MIRTSFAVCAVTVSALLAGADASAAPIVFTSEAAFVAALSGQQSSVDFESAALGTISGNEFSVQGFIFDSPVGSPLGRLEIATFNSSRYLNIDNEPGECCDGWNDSLDITILGGWSAVGFGFVDTSIPSSGTESIVVYDTLGVPIYTYGSPQSSTEYFGIISDVPIGRVFVTEDAGDQDDAGYDNFRLGNPNVVPEPATLLLFGSGLVGLSARRRRR